MKRSQVHRQRRGARLTALVLALVVAAAACGGGDDDDNADPAEPSVTVGEPQAGGNLTFGMEAESDGLNPTANRFAVAGAMMGMAVFDTLTKFDEKGETHPYLAESLTPNEDYTKWTVKLRPGITFHDGTPLTSEALDVGIQSQKDDPLIGLAVRPVLADPPVTIVDDLTATVNLSRELPYFPAYLTTQLGMIASPKWLKDAKADPALNQEPVGTGPFMIKSRQLGTRTEMVKNPDYWQEGLPYLDSITFVVSTDPQVRAQAFKSGDFDVIHTTRAADIKAFREDSSIQFSDDGGDGEEAFVMLNVSAAPFDDERARRALAHATDRESYLTLIGQGVLEGTNGMFTEGSDFYTDVDNFPAFDLDTAKDLAADYCADEPANCSGDRFTFEYKTTPSEENNSVFDTLAQSWGEVAEVTKVPVEQAQFITDAATGVYNAVLWRQFGAVDPDSDMLWLDSESIGAISLNWPRNSDPEIDEWLDAQRISLDLEERKALWANISEKLNEDLPYIWLNHTVWGIAATPAVQGIADPVMPDGTTKVRPYNNGRIELTQLWLSS